MHLMVLALAKDLTGSCTGLGGAEDVVWRGAEFYDAGAGGVVGLEAVLVALGTFHGVDGLEFFNRLTHWYNPFTK